jgi:type IV secretory pathway ATPase VirB11/archaellum biosynthesis ATPase
VNRAETLLQETPVEVLRLTPPPRANVANAGQFETRPCFASSWIEEVGADSDDTVSSYMISGVRVKITSPRDASYGLYAIDPPEYRLNPVQLQALAESMSAVTKAMPQDMEMNSIDTMRGYIKAKAKDHLYSYLAARSSEEIAGMDLDREAERLSELLCKYTAGYGVLETLLEDRLVQDIYVDAPSSQSPLQVVLRSDAAAPVRQKCRTNIFVGKRDLQGLVSRVKFETGLPFSEAHPVLEADIKRLGARVTLVGPPLSDKGVSVAIRKHSRSIWTVPMLILNGSISPLLASFLWACVMGRRTVLVAGSRGAGKTTLLGAMMLEFPLSQRIILIEDTPELSAARMQSLGYDIQTLRFSNSSANGSASAQDALRVSLRMGESAIVIGEVRGEEARVLYESMRAGSAGSSVLGTIHGNSAVGVLDRAVEDLKISERAFSSTDIVVVIGLIRSPDGTRFSRRVVEVAEVRGDGQGVKLVDLFATEPGCACAKPTADFTHECKTVRGIANALGVGPEEVIEIVKTRAHADQILSELDAEHHQNDAFRVKSNEVLARCLFTASGPEAGLKEWRDWLDARQIS